MKQTKRKRKLAPDAASTSDAAEPAHELQQQPKTVAADFQTAAYVLGPSCTMREGAAMKAGLLKLVAAEQPVALDISGIERIDTAALQLLCAFVHDRRTRGRATQWIGSTSVFNEAVEILGLTQALSYVSGPRA